MAQENVVVKFEADVADFRKELDKIKKQLKGLEGSTKETQKTASGLGDKLGGKITKQLAGFGAAIAGAFAIQGLVRSAAGSIIEFEKSIASLSAITGATGDDLDFLKRKAIELGAASGLGASETAKAFELIGSAKPELLGSGEALASVTEQAILLSQASGLDLVSSANAVTTALNQFGLGAEETSRAVNILAAGAKEGASAIPTTAQALERFGAVASGANVSLEQSVGLVETLAEKQLVGAEAGTQLRNIILKLQQAGKGFVDGQFDIQAALEQVNEEITSIQDPVKQTTTLTKLFGLESVTAAKILLSSTDAVEKYTSAVTGTNVASEQAEKNQDTLSFKTKQLTANWEAFVLSLEDGNGIIGKTARSFLDTTNAILQFLGASEEVADVKSAEVRAIEDTQAALNAELEILARANFTQEERADQIKKINAEFKEYLPNLLDEKTTLEDIRDIQEQVNAAFVKRILLQEQQEELTKLAKIQAEFIKRNLEIRKEQAIVEAELEAARERQLDQESQIAVNAQQAAQANANQADEVERLEKELEDLNRELELNNVVQGGAIDRSADLRKSYNDLIKELGIVTDEVDDNNDGTKTSIGLIEELAQKIKDLKVEQEKSRDPQRIAAITKEVEALEAEIKALKGITEEKKKTKKEEDKDAKAALQLRKLLLNNVLKDQDVELEAKLAKLEEERKAIQENSDLTVNQKKLELEKINNIERELIAKADEEDAKRKKDRQDAAVSLATDTAQAIADIQIAQNERATNAAIQALEERRDKNLITEEEFEAQRAKLLTEQAEKNKQIAITQSIINTALAVTNALANAPDPVTGAILATAAGIVGGTQTALIASEPIPQFAKGGWIDGKSHAQGGTMIEAEKDEYIVAKKYALRNGGILDSINSGTLDSYIQQRYVVPALLAQKAKLASESNDRLASSISMSLGDQKLSDGNLIASDKQTRRILKEISRKLDNNDSKQRYHY